MSLGIDISNHNYPFDVAAFKEKHPALEVVGAKVDEAKTYVDPDFMGFFDQVEKAGLVCVPYHFARPETDKGLVGGVAEADYFLEHIWHLKDRKGLGRPALDYETANDPVFAEAFCKRVQQKLGVTPLIYCSGSRTPEIASRPFTKSCPLWIAVYGPTYSQYVPAGMHVWMWQYTDRYDGLSLDASHVLVDQKQLRVNNPVPVLVVEGKDGVLRKVKYGGGRWKAFLNGPLVKLLKAGKVITLRRRAR